MKNALFLSAMTLLKFGSIEITTKNETNSLNHTKYASQTRAAIAENKQELYNQMCMDNCKKIETTEEPYHASSLHYALEKTLDFKFKEEISHPGRLFSIFIEDYFEQTNKPQEHDLVIYTYNQKEKIITHVGIFINNKTIESKWNSYEARQHELLNIPVSCGNAAWFYTLKKKYKGPNGKNKAAAAIEECIKLQNEILLKSQQ